MKLGLYYLLFYTTSRPAGHAGSTTGPIVRICKDYKDDIGLLEHEKVHIQWWWLTLMLQMFIYPLCRSYRLWSEVKAYKKQLQYPPANGADEYRHIYAGFIADKYGLDISTEDAYKLL